MAREQLILTFTGRDAPSITARLSRILAQAGARLDDVEQVVVQGLLTLGFAVSLDDPEPALKELLFAAKGLGLQLEFRKVPDGAEAPHESYALTVIARTLGPAALQGAFDCALQRETLLRRSKRLVVMDMDSTLIRIEVIDELAREHGVGEEVAGITRHAKPKLREAADSAISAMGLDVILYLLGITGRDIASLEQA